MEDNLYERIKKLCHANNITVAQLEQELKFGTASVRKWKTSSPSIDKIISVASFFNVSTDYILGLDKTIVLDKDIISFQRAHQKMSVRDREKMMQILKIGFEEAFKD